MSVKVIPKGGRRRSENVPKLLQHTTAQNSIVFHNMSKPSPVLSDRREFPSLNESSEKALSNTHTGSVLKYSDKLKSKSLSNNQGIVCDDSHSKRHTLNQHNSKISSKWNPTDDKSNFKKEKSENVSKDCFDKPRFVSTNKIDVNPNQNTPKRLFNQSSKECNLNQPQLHKKELPKQKHLENSFKNSKSSTSGKISNSANLNSTSDPNKQTKYNKSVKLIGEKTDLKEESTDNVQSNAKEKKKKRKSKVKRQVALQSGKITVLTPEVHLKILSQTNGTTSQTSKSVLTDINDEEEYPELGKPLLPTSQKGNTKKDVIVEPTKEAVEKPSESSSEDKVPVVGDNKESPVCDISQKPTSEKKGKGDAKSTVHLKNPITISFYDMLLTKNPKPKVFEEEIDIPDNIGLAKIKIKKDTSRPHNLLDSSSPIVKRGKEREKPKPKKPSQLKKIILLDRKTRREQLLSLKTNNSVGNDAVDIEIENKLNSEELANDADAIETNFPTENNSSEPEEITDQTLLLSPDSYDIATSQQGEIAGQTVMLSTETENNLQVELVPEMQQLSLLETHKPSMVENDFSNCVIENVKARDYPNSSTLQQDKIVCESENNYDLVSSVVTEPVRSVNVSLSPDPLLSSLMNDIKKSEVSNKEKAAKILLHTRNFREYCNHLISKDIDDAVFSLLDDLARFQDRLHQKDPVKARMKRRMINGIKEVKKHIKLRKLKCIIIAVDIENVETQGGLNDILNDIKVSAAEHHIPCVFALGRKVLGKVCRKPVPVSCVGILNFEGSEVNFKKMVELQMQSKADYNEIFSKLTQKLTDEEVSSLLKAKTEAPETLRAIRTDILNDFFMKSKIGVIKNEDVEVKSDQISDLIDSEV